MSPRSLPAVVVAMISLCGALGIATEVEALPISPRSHRVAGIAISVVSQQVNGSGQDVGLEVDMTTSHIDFTRTNVTRDERAGFANSFFTPNELNVSTVGLGGLGDGNIRHYSSASDTLGRPFTGYYYGSFTFVPPRGLFGDSYSGSFLAINSYARDYIEGELPALDLGDGSTTNATTLTDLVSRNTSTISTAPGGEQARRIISHWRGAFSHSYADQEPHVITVASRCCGYSTTRNRGFFSYSTIYTGNVVAAASPSLLRFTNSFSRSRVFRNAYATNTGLPMRGDPLTGTFTDSGGFSGYLSSQNPVNQVTNTVALGAPGGANVLEIPTASSLGLAALAGCLLVLGVALLRRG